jgi:hypothetical protein
LTRAKRVMRNMKAFAILWAVLAAAASAAEVWDTKPFMEWSPKDVDKVLTDSPWAGKATMTHERIGANLGPVPEWNLIVSVRSATPVRMAVARQQLAAGVPASPDLEKNLLASYPRYAIAIAKIPQSLRGDLPKSAQMTVLKVKGKELMANAGVVQLLDKEGREVEPPPARGPQPRPGGGFGNDPSGITATMILEFPKDDAATASDGEVEVSTIIGGYKIRKTFKLKDMMFKGALSF